MERDGMRNPFAFHDNGVHIAGMRSGAAPDQPWSCGLPDLPVYRSLSLRSVQAETAAGRPARRTQRGNSLFRVLFS